MRNIRLLLEYDGTAYHGWQRQKNDLSIQEVVETALGRLTGAVVRLHASGRTDAGVHALGQVANFHTASAVPLPAFVRGLNSMLPKDIAILAAREEPPEFHARYSAKAKTYEYRLWCRPVRPPLELRYCWHLSRPLGLEAMARAAAALLGEHDFSAFRASGGSPGHAVREVLSAAWQPGAEGRLRFTITANGFLRGMVRSLVGTMVEIGQGKRPPEDLAGLIVSGDRRQAGATAPAQGLFLVEVVY
ncbi:MAG: tRNA pseudouridine(38-40) synthase TruA [Syntrophales bacterium]|nr:tRNA pseudouridine(38-40) synthase TruA [Syntrophales bacterium]MDD5642180.1 tRNA pseudouridine(38-40) synthase TruA [Syntrophales bacterium]